MFLRGLSVEYVDADGQRRLCPIKWIDSFAMRRFTNDRIFDDTLPVRDGWMEAGRGVPLDRLEAAMQDWFCRKGYLSPGEKVELKECLDNRG